MATLVHAFDVESSAARLGERRLMSIGACCLEIPRTGPTEVIDRFFAVIEWPDGLMFDSATQKFWAGLPDALRTNTTAGRPPGVVAGALAAHLERVQRMAARRRVKYVAVTDNAHFDVPWIDWLLSTHTTSEPPLRYNRVTGWMKGHQMIDLSQRIGGLDDARVPHGMAAFHPSVPHDHTPLNDAIGLAERYAFYCRGVKGARRP